MRLRAFALFLSLLLSGALLAACQRGTSSLAYVLPRDAAATATRVRNTMMPTANLATWTPTATATATATATPTQTPSVTPTDIGTPLARETSAPTWTPPPQSPPQLGDHYHLGRPIASGATNWVDRSYPYGSTSGRRLPLHHGVEFVNARNTPVLAAAAGTVHFAGKDEATQFGPAPNYYGNLVVLRHDSSTPQGQALFSLYGHLEAVQRCQRTARGDWRSTGAGRRQWHRGRATPAHGSPRRQPDQLRGHAQPGAVGCAPSASMAPWPGGYATHPVTCCAR